MSDLYVKHRPIKLEEVVGQEAAVRVLETYLKSNTLPQAILLTGGSGVGKTTTARILAKRVGCKSHNVVDLNCAIVDPMETVRSIEKATRLRSLGGNTAYILDEFQGMSRAPHAQQACLKLFEEPPAYAYFFLCSTDPHKIIPTIRNRCTEIKLTAIPKLQLAALIDDVAAKEGVRKFPLEVNSAIADAAGGSARVAIKLLQKVIGLPTKREQLEQIVKESVGAAGIDLCKALMNPRTNWLQTAAILKGLREDDPESLRKMVLAYCTTAALGGNGNALAVLQAFRDNTYDPGFAGIVLAASEVKRK